MTFVVTTFKCQALKDGKPDSVVVQAIYLRVQNVTKCDSAVGSALFNTLVHPLHQVHIFFACNSTHQDQGFVSIF